VALFPAAGVGGHALGYEMKIVVPNALENVEGDSAAGADFFGVGVRAQFLYPASEFASLPTTHRLITGLAVRPTQRLGGPVRLPGTNFRYDYPLQKKLPMVSTPSLRTT
jgi:hypothetical protein